MIWLVDTGDARIKLGYNYAIRGIAAIAPTDGKYKPAGVDVTLENVNYFALHGSADGDVQSFHASRVYHRAKFTGDDDHFASTLYIHDANHGQFNTGWGRFDGERGIGERLLNYAQIMPGADQRRIATVYLSAYLETILHDQTGYLPLFRDFRVAREWLPDTIYLQQFRDSRHKMVATYEEDIDVTTTTLAGGKSDGRGLRDWKEREIKLKLDNTDTRAVFLGWEHNESGSASSYTISLPQTNLGLNGTSSLIFSLTDGGAANEMNKEPIDFTIELIDASGESASLPLHTVGRVQRQIESHIMKFDWLAKTKRFEPLFQSFEFALAAFAVANPKLKLETLRSVRFVFDQTKKGLVILDDVGFH